MYTLGASVNTTLALSAGQQGQLTLLAGRHYIGPVCHEAGSLVLTLTDPRGWHFLKMNTNPSSWQYPTHEVGLWPRA